jgi:osmotically-inducible protein OsmY
MTGESNEAVGGPASTEVGSSKSDMKPQSQVGTTSDYQSPLFKNNRAQGVGSAATGEFGVANSDHLNENSPANNDSRISDSDLAQKVKEDLVKGSTGTVGVSRTEAKNIKVSAKDGVITLKGNVPSEKDKQMLEIRAMQFRGVNRVQNDLTVSPEASPASRDTGNGRDLENRTDSLQH